MSVVGRGAGMIGPLFVIGQVEDVLPNGSAKLLSQSACTQCVHTKLILVKAASGNPDLLDRCLEEIQSVSFGGVE